MTVDLEGRVRASLRRRAESLQVEVPEPDLGRLPTNTGPRGRARRLELVAVAAALALFVGAGLVIALAGREGTSPTVAHRPTSTAPAADGLSAVIMPGALVSMPSPWLLQRFSFTSGAMFDGTQSSDSRMIDGNGSVVPTEQARSVVEYGFGDGSRTIQLHFYALGDRVPTVTSPEPPLVELRGTTGYFLDYGDGRYRVQWDEGGRTWDVDGHGFGSLDDLVTTLAALRQETDTDWAAFAPAGLPEALLGNPDGNVSWNEAGDPRLVVDPGSTRSRHSSPTTNPGSEAEPDGPLLSASRCADPRPSLVIYLRTNATPAEIDAVAEFLRSADGVERYDYLDQEGSYVEFSEIFADSPEMVASVRPSDLPSSFTVVADESTARSLADPGLPGIQKTFVMPCSDHPY